MGEVFYLNLHAGRADSPVASLGTLRHLTGMSPGEFSAAIAYEAGEPVPASVYMAYEDGETPPAVILSAARRVVALSHVSAEPGDEVVAAAHQAEAERLALLADPSCRSVAELWEAVAEVARAGNRRPGEIFAWSRRIRCQALKMIEQTHRPGTLADLYVVAGQATALMASTAFDLDRWDASAAFARSAVSYAELVGSAPLHAWTLGLAALLANWRNEPDIALGHFRRGMGVAPRGIPQIRLRYIAARSYALLGDAASVGEVLGQARRDQDNEGRYRDPLSEETGGEFAFGRARAEACAAAAWLDLGRGDDAKRAAYSAVADYTSLPAGHRPHSQDAGVRIDLATACLLRQDLDEAEGVLSEMLAVPGSLANVSLSGRLAKTRTVLAGPFWVKDPAAQRLSEAIGEWLAESVS